MNTRGGAVASATVVGDRIALMMGKRAMSEHMDQAAPSSTKERRTVTIRGREVEVTADQCAPFTGRVSAITPTMRCIALDPASLAAFDATREVVFHINASRESPDALGIGAAVHGEAVRVSGAPPIVVHLSTQ